MKTTVLRISILFLSSILISSCATKAKVVGNFIENPPLIESGTYDEIIVSGFDYSSMRQTSQYAGSSEANGYVTNYYEVVKEYSDGDISLQLAQMLKNNGIAAKALKDVNSKDLKPGQVLLTGNLQLYNWGSFKGWEIIPFFVGLGNILPAPWGFRVGAFVNYSAEVVNADGEILYQVPQKSAYASYKHWWVWGAMAMSKKDFEKASDLLGPKAFNEILSVFEENQE